MIIKKFIYFLSFIFLIGLIFVITQLLIYRNDIKNNSNFVNKCAENSQSYDYIIRYSDKNNIPIRAVNDCNSCYCKMYDMLIPKLLIYKVWSDNKPLNFIKFITFNNYVISPITVKNADIIISVNHNISNINFEKNLFDVFQKPLYIFEYVENSINPGKQIIQVAKIKKSDKNDIIISEYKTYTNYEQIINKLKLTDKKIFFKFDLNSDIANILNEIFLNSENITGFVIKAGFYDSYSLTEYAYLLNNIEKNFVLVHRTGSHFFSIVDSKCKYSEKNIPIPMYLTFINKKLISKKYLPVKQDYSSDTSYKEPYNSYHIIPKMTINWRIILYEKIKDLINNDG